MTGIYIQLADWKLDVEEVIGKQISMIMLEFTDLRRPMVLVVLIVAFV